MKSIFVIFCTLVSMLSFGNTPKSQNVKKARNGVFLNEAYSKKSSNYQLDTAGVTYQETFKRSKGLKSFYLPRRKKSVKKK